MLPGFVARFSVHSFIINGLEPKNKKENTKTAQKSSRMAKFLFQNRVSCIIIEKKAPLPAQAGAGITDETEDENHDVS